MDRLVIVIALLAAFVVPASAATPTPHPVSPYVALDAGKPGQPKLTAAEIARIRETLNEVKPCQRPLLRYILPIATFFAVESIGHGYSMPHIFGTHNEVYWQAESRAIPMMRDTTDAEAVAEQKCP
jgi:hypothetical protein